MAYSVELYNLITSFLKDDDWHFDSDEERGIIKMGVTLENKLSRCRMMIDVDEERYIVYATIPINADDDCKSEMADLLNRINWTLAFGCFEMDEEDGEIRFRMPVSCKGGCFPNREMIRESVVVPVLVANRYGNAIVKVLMGMASAEEALKTSGYAN